MIKSTTYLGQKIYASGGRYCACVVLPRGNGRVRKSAPATDEGLDSLHDWIDSVLNAKTSIEKPLTQSEIADARLARTFLPEGATLTDAAREYAERHSVKRIGVGDAGEEWIESLRRLGRRPRTVQSARTHLNHLSKYFNLDVSGFTVEMAKDVCAAYKSPRSANDVRTTLHGFFSFCIRNGYAKENPFAAIPPAKFDFTPPGIYKPEDVANLFATAEEKFPSDIPALALMFFAGIRTSGLERMVAGDVDVVSGTVSIPPVADKLRRGYIARMHRPLKEWLSAYPPHGKIAKGDCQGNFHKHLQLLYAKAKFTHIRNGARHSFASYALAIGEMDAPSVALSLGHFGASDTLLAHYRRIATPQAAKEYFAILPRICHKSVTDSSPAGEKTGGRKAAT